MPNLLAQVCAVSCAVGFTLSKMVARIHSVQLAQDKTVLTCHSSILARCWRASSIKIQKIGFHFNIQKARKKFVC
jgi:hypothetical protein